MEQHELQAVANSFIQDAMKHFSKELKDKTTSEVVVWLEKNIENLLCNSKDANGLLQIIASVFGEMIITEYGGDWRYDADRREMVILLNNDNTLFPSSIIQARYDIGSQASLKKFFETIKDILN